MSYNRKGVKHMLAKEFMKQLSEEKNGYGFGKPWRFNKDSLVAVVPITKRSRAKRTYLTMREAKKVTVKDTGSINRVEVTSGEELPVFVCRGEIFKGSTQERASVRSVIVMPKETVQVEVVCVHASKGIMMGASMTSSGYTPYEVSLDNQMKAWNSVSSYNCSLKSMMEPQEEDRGHTVMDAFMGGTFNHDHTYSSNDDLHKSMESYSKVIEDVLKEVPWSKNQTGMMVLDLDGFYSLELYDVSASWEAVREAVAKKEGKKLSEMMKEQEESVFEYRPEKAEYIAKTVLNYDFSEKIVYQVGNAVTMNLDYSGKIFGEVTILEGKVIHLTLAKKREG